tara:strand:+ start:3267 stop:4211 length:945 start_codon:yes stop_codon:yes gene_type:complete
MTYTTQTAVGEREQLADVIYRIDPDETPIFSALKKETSNGIFTEWQVQELASASATNYATEGADASIVAPTATVRLGNYHQISVKAVAVSKTLDAVEKAGRDREVAYQKVLKSLELRRDIEKAIGDTDVARSGSDPRKSASLSCWITNGSVGAAGTFAAGVGTDTITAGTARALTLALIEDGMQDAWTDGGNPKMMVASATNRANFSDLSASGNLVSNDVNMTAAKEVTYVGSTSVFLTDFGTIEVAPSRFMGNDRIFLIDPDFASLATINGRNFAENEVAPTGDAEKFQIVTEWALKVQAPKAHAGIFDLSGA